MWDWLRHRLGLCHKARLGYRCHRRPGECGNGSTDV